MGSVEPPSIPEQEVATASIMELGESGCDGTFVRPVWLQLIITDLIAFIRKEQLGRRRVQGP
jgi:hypothetical protein